MENWSFRNQRIPEKIEKHIFTTIKMLKILERRLYSQRRFDYQGNKNHCFTKSKNMENYWRSNDVQDTLYPNTYKLRD